MKKLLFSIFILVTGTFAYDVQLPVNEYTTCYYNSSDDNYDSKCVTENEMKKIHLYINNGILVWNNTKFTVDTSYQHENCIGVSVSNNGESYYIALCSNPDDTNSDNIQYINFVDVGQYKITFDINYDFAVENDDDNDTAYYSGSGFGVSDYYIVTNYHVARVMNEIEVYKNGELYTTATVKYADSLLDLAIIKTKKPVLSCQISDENQSIGSEIYVYGYPKIELMGVSLKVTKGIISSNFGYRDDLHTYQIDAAIQSGNSGGPVVKNNKIVGITVSMLKESQNVNYAIKSVYLNAFLKSVNIKTGGVNVSNPTNCTYLLFGSNK